MNDAFPGNPVTNPMLWGNQSLLAEPKRYLDIMGCPKNSFSWWGFWRLRQTWGAKIPFVIWLISIYFGYLFVIWLVYNIYIYTYARPLHPRHLDSDLSSALNSADGAFYWERLPFILEASLLIAVKHVVYWNSLYWNYFSWQLEIEIYWSVSFISIWQAVSQTSQIKWYNFLQTHFSLNTLDARPKERALKTT